MNLIMPIIGYLSLWIDIASEIVFALVLTCLNWLGKFALAIIFFVFKKYEDTSNFRGRSSCSN